MDYTITLTQDQIDGLTTVMTNQKFEGTIEDFLLSKADMISQIPAKKAAQQQKEQDLQAVMNFLKTASPETITALKTTISQ